MCNPLQTNHENDNCDLKSTENDICLVCQVNTSNCVLMPCGHGGLC